MSLHQVCLQLYVFIVYFSRVSDCLVMFVVGFVSVYPIQPHFLLRI